MTPDKFRPIALCNVVYKIISKMIANRLKPLLLALVSEEKTGFVEGRQILNNIIQAHEVVHSLKSNKKVDSFSILLNDSPYRTFMPSRGLKQGDSLSPFLFVLMMEGLGRAIKMENAEGRIQGLKLTLDGDAYTHQQFVDDTMLQGIPIVKEARAFKQILNEFSLATSREVSLDKSKVVLQTIPIFMFSVLPAPKGVMQQIKGIQRDFLWGKGEEKKKWALVAWYKLCKPKAHGGLGLHDPKTISRVLGAKLWWRWLKESATPCAKLWKQRYANNWQERDHIPMSGLIKGSYIWNLAWKNKAIVQKHSFWEIRAGNLARFWEDNW
eukprot:PITA_16575